MSSADRNNSAFTLVELLVVIAIIGLVATLSVLALANSRINARDSKRFSDIKQIQTALELFYSDAGRYPTSAEFGSGRLEYLTAGATSTYISQIPAAPAQNDGDCSGSDNSYNYQPSADGSTYVIDFCVAKKNSDLPSGRLIAFPGGITYNHEIPNCSAETDNQLCSRLGKNCGSVSSTDNCGNARTVANCGDCSGSQNCNNGNCVEFTCGANVVSYNGYDYATVAIGGQCWFKENLKTTKFRNGSDIPKAISISSWRTAIEPIYGPYNNDDANGVNYGQLYSGRAAMSPLGLCPSGWRVPSRADFTTLIAAVGASSGVKLKSCRTPGSPLSGDCDTSIHPYWLYNASAYGTDNSGFGALPGGEAAYNFNYFGTQAFFWTTTPYSFYIDDRNYYIAIYYSSVDASAANNQYQAVSDGGLSVRCIKGETVAGKSLATVTTVAPSNITANVATAGGTITADGGSVVYDKGVVWSEQDNPTIGSSQSTFKSMGSLNTAFSGQISGLWAGKTYYLRAYALNEAGIAYGNTVTFDTYSPCGTVTSVNYNGSTYTAVPIGTQCWFKENLKTTKFRDGTNIQYLTNRDTWRNLTYTGYGYYNGDVSYVDSYGALYSGYAATSPLKLCPEGWRVPSRNDWLDLIAAVGVNSGIKLKSCRMPGSPLGGSCDTNVNPYWNYSATAYGVDYYNFSAVPGGYISGGSSGNFNYLNSEGHFWTTTPYVFYLMDRNYYVSIPYGSVEAYSANNGYQYLNGGLSVRCIKGETVPGKSLATISTVAVTNITANTATAGGTITADGGSVVYDKGVVWSEQNNPTIGNSNSTFRSSGTMSTSYSTNIDGLWAGKTYYLRAYAVNEAGIAYGNVVTFSSADPCNGTSSVDYDNYTYSTIGIGNQCWIRENLKTHKLRDGTDIPVMGAYNTWRNLDYNSYGYGAYNNDISISANYGELYSGSVATSPLGICPAGWRVPSVTDFNTLITAASPNSASRLKSCRMPGSTLGGNCDTSTHPYWLYTATNQGTDYYGFSALPGGYFSGGQGGFSYFGSYAHFWTTSAYTADRNYYASVYYSTAEASVGGSQYTFLNGGLSIRCIKGETNPSATLATITTVNSATTTANTAIVGGTVVSDGGFRIYNKGVLWSEQNNNPTFGGSQINFKSASNMSTSFTTTIDGLWAGKTYYLRAYAVNEAGITYGDVVTFTTPDPCAGISSVNYDGYSYPTMAIGLQCWFRENLRTHKFKDGSDIPYVANQSAWRTLAGPGYGPYNGDTGISANYGELYSGYAATDARGLCPDGWHVPTLAEFNALINAASPNSALRLKSCRMPGSPLGGSCDTSTHPYWTYVSSSNYGNDYYGFSALPGGYISGGSSGTFNYFGTYAYFWTTTVYITGRNSAASVYYNTAEATAGGSTYGLLAAGLSVRCVKD